MMDEVGCVRQKFTKRGFHRLGCRWRGDQIRREDFVSIRKIVDPQQDGGTVVWSADYSVSTGHGRLI